MDTTRRDLLKFGAVALAASMFAKPALAGFARPEEKSLCLYNLHTGERLKTVFWEKGVFIPEALQEVNYLLRDYRTNEVSPMDPELLNLMHELKGITGKNREFHIISGYRCPKTNAMLNNRSEGVAKKSLHMLGKAVDIRMPGYDLRKLREAALSLQSGGVGYYPVSDFIHIDTGRVRWW